MRKCLFAGMVAASMVFAAGLMGGGFPDPPKVTEPAAKQATTVLAGGCFWGMQGIFEHVKGVIDTEAGYSGGSAKTAHYERIEEGDTGHAESLRITYDPARITYGQLLKIYFSVAHDPTTKNRQHNDVGTQYRSVIFYSGDEQKQVADEYIKELNTAHVFRHQIVTQVVPLQAFYRAEEYHQHFLDLNPTQPYIAGVDIPLLENFKRTYPELYKKSTRGED